MRFTLPARQPFSLPAVITSHGWVQLAPFSYDPDYTTFEYTVRLASGNVVQLHVSAAPGGIAVEVDAALPPAEEAELRQALAWMLGLEQDFSAFYAAAGQHPKLSKAIQQAKGRVLRSPTFFEDTVKTILTTNTAWSGTRRMVLNLVTQFGEPHPADNDRRAFPTPERLAAADVEALRTSAKLGYRAPYVLELAQRVASGELDLEAYRASDLPTPELRKELLAIKGVGGYAAANLLVLLGRSDFIPIDSWALKMVSNEWHDGQPIGPAEVEAAFEAWGPWKGLAYWFWDWKE